MTFSVNKVSIPPKSEIAKTLNNAHYFDCYRFYSTKKSRNALQIWLEQASKTPAWVNFLMETRNRIVSLFGLKNLGRIDSLDNTKLSDQYQVNDKIGIFTLLYISENEIIMGDSDKHLNVQISVYRDCDEPHLISMSTVVHVHNFWGKVYMLFVKPMHQIIVPSSIVRAETTH